MMDEKLTEGDRKARLADVRDHVKLLAESQETKR
jgi:hypothetical protein